MSTGAFSIHHISANNWADFKTIRLKALATNPELFGSTLARESAFTDTDWQAWVSNPKSPCFCLYNNGSVIGCTGIVSDRTDDTGKTAVLIASFIEPAYRGLGLSQLLYKARLEYAHTHKYWQKIIVGHRDGNEASRRANQRHGFIFTHRAPKTWPDGTSADELVYALDIDTRNAAKSAHE